MIKSKEDVVWEINDKYSRVKALRVSMPNGDETPISVVCGYDDDNLVPIRAVTDRYQPVSTEEIVKIAIDKFGMTPSGENVCMDRFGSKVRVRSFFKEDQIKVSSKAFDLGNLDKRFNSKAMAKNPGDLIQPMLEVTNSYCAVTGILIKIGWFRLVCSNGLVIPVSKEMGQISRTVHTVHEVETMMIELKKLKLSFSKSKPVFKKLQSTKMTVKEIESIAKLIPKNHREEFSNYADLGKNSMWAVLNSLTFIQSHRLSIARGKIIQPLIEKLWISAA